MKVELGEDELGGRLVPRCDSVRAELEKIVADLRSGRDAPARARVEKLDLGSLLRGRQDPWDSDPRPQPWKQLGLSWRQTAEVIAHLSRVIARIRSGDHLGAIDAAESALADWPRK